MFRERLGRLGPAVWAAGAVLLAVLILIGFRVARPPVPKPGPAPRAEAGERQGTEPTITLYVKDTGQVRRIKMEDYVAGVVAGEIKNDWPREALKAQAVLARTFTLYKMSKGKTPHGTDASTDPAEFQAYNPANINDNIRAAVRETRGLVMTYNGQPINAFFHSCAGGRTATAEEGADFRAEPTPYLKVVSEPPCPDPTKERWSATFTKAEVLAALRKLGVNLGDFSSVRIAARGPSGRATRIAFDGATVSGPALRTALGPDRMRSTLLETLRVSGDAVVMGGRGWGHGVGLSQFGALDKARKGWDARRILQHYYSGVRLERRWR